jgi:hypothetical protein
VDAGLQIVHHAEGNIVGLLDDTALLFVRNRPLREQALDAIERTAQRFGLAPGRPVGALAVVDGNAGMSERKLIERQRTFMRGFVRSDGEVYVAMAVLGDSVQSTTMRAVVRLFTVGNRRIQMSASIDEAARWLGPRLKLGPLRLASALGDLQKLLEAEP